MTYGIETLETLLDQHSIPYGRIYTAPDMLRDPHYAAREMIRRFEVETLGREIPMAAPVPKFSRTESKIETVGPRLGQHTDWALKKLIKSSDNELTVLRSAGVIL